jgi:hypothetical protein
MAGFKILAQAPTGLRDDLDAALDQPALADVGLEGFEGNACHLAAYQLDRLDDVGKARDVRARRH